ncbi:MAG: hypothetical protein KDA90_08175 [Planctomycetaceae bacterium]|nr:hypothetical protein [Planctomycetaceae bacterium]
MFSKVASTLLTAILFATLAGCGGGEPVVDNSADAVVESIRTSLTGVASHGEGGSALDSLRNDFERLREADAAKAGEIEADLKKLLTTGSSDQRKSLATDILGKL